MVFVRLQVLGRLHVDVAPRLKKETLTVSFLTFCCCKLTRDELLQSIEPVYLCSFFVLAVKIAHHKALLVQFGDPNKPVTTK